MNDQVQLEKISHVEVYTAMCENAQECWDMLKLVRDAGIPHSHLNWHNETTIPQIVQSTKDQSFFNGEEWFSCENLESVPFVKWSVLYDDVTIRQNIATSIAELTNSQLWENLNKVV